MAKLILSLNGIIQGEYALNKERILIGRKPDSDIRIDNLAVSSKHALIVTILDDSFLEDLGSTNGTYVNGKLIKKHALKNGDVIGLGKHELKYGSLGITVGYPNILWSLNQDHLKEHPRDTINRATVEYPRNSRVERQV
jgi:hypothetical protein